MATYLELKAQAETLLRQAEEARLAELQTVLDEVRARIAEYGLTPEQVFGRKRAVRKDAGAKAVASIAKYRDPKTGTTWSGREPEQLTSSPRPVRTRVGSIARTCCGVATARTAPSRTRRWAISRTCPSR
ncbi:DNA-binding protein H-NS [Burkholderia sp. D7]|nr:DNA-binding protein H-NS [Burkholderia sp. D7]